jgi:dTDP-4-amino-4,6-dideoxygalactose transaminase
MTNSAQLAERVRLLRTHGVTRDPAQLGNAEVGAWYYEQLELGYNYRLTDLQAALGSSQLQRLDQFLARRAELVARYDELLRDLPLERPVRPADRRSAHHLYPVRVDPKRISRERVFARLRAAGIGVNVHYIPVHMQPYYRALGFRPGDFPAAEAYYAGALSLPLHYELTDAEQDYVIVQLKDALSKSSVDG